MGTTWAIKLFDSPQVNYMKHKSYQNLWCACWSHQKKQTNKPFRFNYCIIALVILRFTLWGISGGMIDLISTCSIYPKSSFKSWYNDNIRKFGGTWTLYLQDLSISTQWCYSCLNFSSCVAQKAAVSLFPLFLASNRTVVWDAIS